MKKILMIAVLALLGAGKVQAADERARRDINRVPVLMGVTTGTNEIRRIRVTEDGFVLFVSTGDAGTIISGTVTADQGAAGVSAWLVDGSGFTQPISAAALPLPSGAATEASLTSIDGKTPSLGQAALAASVPVAIASDQGTLPTAPVDTGNDTPSESFTNVTTAASVMSADAGREGMLICNEGPEVARCGSGSITTTTGQRLLVDECYSLDAPAKPYKGALSCLSTTGPSTKIHVTETD